MHAPSRLGTSKQQPVDRSSGGLKVVVVAVCCGEHLVRASHGLAGSSGDED